jgi:hypothetical protein
MSLDVAATALDTWSVAWYGAGLGIAFLLSLAFILILLFYADIDIGFLGLMFLLMMIFFLVGFSFLVAASAKGLDIKVSVVVVDGLVLLGTKLLTPQFLRYLSS